MRLKRGMFSWMIIGLLAASAPTTWALGAPPSSVPLPPPPPAGWDVEAPGRPPASAIGKIRDMATIAKVRRALEKDRTLQAQNLIVEVENGVVTISGPAPTPQVARQAVARVEALPQVAQVRSNLYITEPARRRWETTLR